MHSTEPPPTATAAVKLKKQGVADDIIFPGSVSAAAAAAAAVGRIRCVWGALAPCAYHSALSVGYMCLIQRHFIIYTHTNVQRQKSLALPAWEMSV